MTTRAPLATDTVQRGIHSGQQRTPGPGGRAGHQRNRDSVAAEADRLDNGDRRAGGLPWLMLRGDVEEAGFTALPSDAEIRYGTEPTRIEQDTGGVSVTLTSAGAAVTERFDLVVGALHGSGRTRTICDV